MMAARKAEPDSWQDFTTAAASRKQQGPKCGVARMLQSWVPEGARDAVLAAIEDADHYQATSVARALADRLGEKAPNAHVIAAHRRGDCRCKRDKEAEGGS